VNLCGRAAPWARKFFLKSQTIAATPVAAKHRRRNADYFAEFLTSQKRRVYL
jgi:hypothetical protein